MLLIIIIPFCLTTTEMNTQFWWGNLKERGHLEDISIERKIILKWILKFSGEDCGLHSWNAEEVEVATACEYGNKSSGLKKCRTFFDCFTD
jgi:hypothetical protein